MNNMRLIRTLKSASRIRCKYWSTCGRDVCDHYEPHFADTFHCLYNSPVKYCEVVNGFVHDVPYVKGMYAEDECDPNLAFKAKRDAQRRHKNADMAPDMENDDV